VNDVAALILRSGPKDRVSKDEGGRLLAAMLRDAAQKRVGDARERAFAARLLSMRTAVVDIKRNQISTTEKSWREFSILPRPRRGGLLGGFTDNATLGYLAGALNGGNPGQSIGRGLEGWMRGTRLDDQRRVPAQTYAALAAAGVPDALAQAAALNPAVMKAIAPGYFGAKADGSGETATLTPMVNDAARDAPREPSFDTAAVAALNTAVTRLGDFARAADEFSSPGGGAAVSTPRQPPQILARNAADIAQALRASGIGDDDLRALAGTLESSRSSAQFKAAVGRTLDLLGARL
jgi:hypothetical protein